MQTPDPETLAIAALVFLAEDAARLRRFLALTGLETQDLRAAAAAPGFLAHVLEHLIQDESLLLAFTAQNSLPPQTVMRALRHLGGEGKAQEGSWQESW